MKYLGSPLTAAAMAALALTTVCLAVALVPRPSFLNGNSFRSSSRGDTVTVKQETVVVPGLTLQIDLPTLAEMLGPNERRRPRRRRPPETCGWSVLPSTLHEYREVSL